LLAKGGCVITKAVVMVVKPETVEAVNAAVGYLQRRATIYRASATELRSKGLRTQAEQAADHEIASLAAAKLIKKMIADASPPLH
jgi:hypothetical protein